MDLNQKDMVMMVMILTLEAEMLTYQIFYRITRLPLKIKKKQQIHPVAERPIHLK